jgi:hypothetical protein
LRNELYQGEIIEEVSFVPKRIHGMDADGPERGSQRCHYPGRGQYECDEAVDEKVEGLLIEQTLAEKRG